jgi:hypothetical protein
LFLERFTCPTEEAAGQSQPAFPENKIPEDPGSEWNRDIEQTMQWNLLRIFNQRQKEAT